MPVNRLLADVGNRCDLNQGIRLHQPALNTEPRGFFTGKILGVDLIDCPVIGPVGDKDGIHGDVLHCAACGFNHVFDDLQNVTGLCRGIANVHHVVVFIKRQRPGNVHHAIGERARNKRCQWHSTASGNNGAFRHR
ncbi:hypothetical protein COLO4_02045 [Corchorus olitorius]|uniref:Uncharacterized protein n=1 Tax=Corchorus olitorius TaxID=93759 RepID=A0A1R3L1R0_9ROSI|nr:hypothetical protein COLO4_02045 [Corchorus olitorius]